MTTPSEYSNASAPDKVELGRLRLLEELTDPLTITRLERIGVGLGSRCLEVGAGAGSIATWLAGRVGPSGSVTALDIDLRFLRSGLPANVKAVEGDIRGDCSFVGQFDLVHCRSVLMHVPDPVGALRNLADRVAPGGWLFVEDGDQSSVACAVEAHPLGPAWEKRFHARLATLKERGVLRGDWARHAQAQLAKLDFESVDGDGVSRVRRGGGPSARWWKTTEAYKDVVCGPEPPFEPAPALTALMDDPDFYYVDFTMFGAWGKKPQRP
jgi:SAM-dependent methyltransferase